MYALGATLHRLLAGRTPADAAARGLGQELAPLWRVNPTVSRSVSDAVADALALDPDDRPPSVRHLLHRLGVSTEGLDMADEVLDGDRDAGAATEPVVPAPPAAAPGRTDLPGSEVADPDGPTEHVRAAHPVARHAPVAEPLLAVGPTPDAADPDGVTEVVARRSSVRPAPPAPRESRPTVAAPQADPLARGAVRPGGHVVPAPQPRPTVAPEAPAPVPVQLEGPGGPVVGRSWLTIPLGLAAVALASAQPLTVTLLLALVVAPLLATAGDRLLQPHRSAGLLLPWWLRNVAIGAFRALGAVVVLGFGICLWYGTEVVTALAPAGPWVLRATGVAAAGIVCLSTGRGRPGFRSNLALDALARRLMPRGTPTVAVGVVLLAAVALGAAGLWFQPEAWPLGG